MSTARGLASQAGSRWQQLPASRREGECSSMQRVAPTPIAPTPVAATFAPRRRRSDAVSCRGDAQRVQCSLLSREPAASQTRTPGGKRQRIVILGGGLGGLYAAIRLDMLVWRGEKPEIILIDQEERFVFKPLLYELVTGEMALSEVAPSFQELVQGTGIRFIRSKVQVVEPEQVLKPPADQPGTQEGSLGGGGILLEDGTTVPYDWLIIALGAKARATGVPGAKECAIPFVTLQDAERAKSAMSRAVAARGGAARALVVGGGYAGVELAATLRTRLGPGAVIQLVVPRDDILVDAPAGQQAAARAALARNSIQILTNRRVQEMSRDTAQPQGSSPVTVSFAGGEPPVQADVVLWAAGQEPVGVPSFGGDVGMDIPVLSSSGKTLTEDTLRVRRHERVFAIGDGAASSAAGNQQLPATAQVAFQQADYCAWNVWASIMGKPLLPFRYQHLGTMMSLGGDDASVVFPIGDVVLNGPFAVLMRKAAYAYRMPTDMQRLRVAAGLIVRPLVDLLARPAGL